MLVNNLQFTIKASRAVKPRNFNKIFELLLQISLHIVDARISVCMYVVYIIHLIVFIYNKCVCVQVICIKEVVVHGEVSE